MGLIFEPTGAQTMEISMDTQRPFTILCLASEFKGIPFILEAKRQGCRVILVTPEAFAGHPWPWESIDLHFQMPDLHTQPNITYAVSYLARGNAIDRIVALDDYDVATAAALREHLRLPGLGESRVRHFRDKLAMRGAARQAGILVPEFTAVFNYDRLRDFMARVPPPWVLKPRFDAGAMGIRKLHDGERLWRTLDELGDQQSYYLLEQFVPGDVFHVDSLWWADAPVFSIASQYGAPPLAITQGGGIFNTRTLARDAEPGRTLLARNADLLRALGLGQGVSHTEFIRAHADGRFYFLETAARVGGANIDRMVKAATDIELWGEAARIVVADLRGAAYQLPPHRDEHAGLIICLARQEYPDLSGYTDPEIVWRLDKPYHAGLLVASHSAQRVAALLEQYNGRFAHDFLAHAPSRQQGRTTF
jgi:biotin carboxylase